MSWPRRLVATILLSAASGLFTLVLPAAMPESVTPSSAPPVPPGLSFARNSRRTAVVEVVERVRGSIVNIHSERTARGPSMEELFSTAPSQNRINGMGTGIIIDPRGYLVTNQHVVEDVSVIRVRLSDGATYNGRVLARESETDLALLKIDANRPLPTIPLGTATDLMVGETVVAMGNAYGYEHTVTVGVISALKRDVSLNKEIAYKSLIQTDASINPGNSGGPLLNINGELIGVNVAIRAGAQGIGFAIPVETVLRVASDLVSIRKRNGTWHGLVYRDQIVPLGAPDEKEGAALTRSLLVERTDPASPAEQAGLQRGDVIVQVGEVRVSCGLELERALLDRPAGEHVPVVVRRQGSEQRAELVLQNAARLVASAPDLIWRKLGLRLAPVNGEHVTRTNAQLHGGLAVLDVNAESPGARAGLLRGDILIGLHQWETITLDNVAYVLNHQDLANFLPLRFFIVRSGIVHRGLIPQVD